MFSDGSRIVIRHVRSAIGDLIQKFKTKQAKNKKTSWGHMLLVGGNYHDILGHFGTEKSTPSCSNYRHVLTTNAVCKYGHTVMF